MFSIKQTGSFEKSKNYLQKVQKVNIAAIMASCGQEGVDALARMTPTDSGLTARSWTYEVTSQDGYIRIAWKNSDVENGFPVAVMLQYGYGTGTGGYVHGRDYINPAIRPIFDKIADKVWKAVTST